jgi:hypothetical protein
MNLEKDTYIFNIILYLRNNPWKPYFVEDYIEISFVKKTPRNLVVKFPTWVLHIFYGVL